jgi:electron transfer flavoprotein beta subunit
MHIIVCMKQVPDLEKIRIKSDTRQPVLEGVPWRLGEFEKNALEEAVRIKEKRDDVKVTVISIGSPKLKDTIKEALAIGADEAILLTDPLFEGNDTAASAKVLAKVIQSIGDYDLILMGEGSTDEHSGQVPSRLAELLGLPQVTYVRELTLFESKSLRAIRDLEDALEVVEVNLPAVVTVTPELNEPRLPPLTAILKAARKPINIWNAQDIGIAAEEVGVNASAIKELSNLAPLQQRKQVILDGDMDDNIDELIRALQREGVLTL